MELFKSLIVILLSSVLVNDIIKKLCTKRKNCGII